jgi:DNA/RNA endonuclease G (NUC1)
MVERNGELYVVSGSVLTEFIDTIGTTSRIPVPKYYYKVALKLDGTHLFYHSKTWQLHIHTPKWLQLHTPAKILQL